MSQIEIFSRLKPEEQQRFAMKAADVRLRPGDWLVRDGERSGFFVILEGRVQFTKDIHGREHTVQEHGPGEFFGELPNLLGTASGASIRAKTKCRIVTGPWTGTGDFDVAISDRPAQYKAQHYAGTLYSSKCS
jgi:thioredoxin reductase (NADPH)